MDITIRQQHDGTVVINFNTELARYALVNVYGVPKLPELVIPLNALNAFYIWCMSYSLSIDADIDFITHYRGTKRIK